MKTVLLYIIKPFACYSLQILKIPKFNISQPVNISKIRTEKLHTKVIYIFNI